MPPRAASPGAGAPTGRVGRTRLRKGDFLEAVTAHPRAAAAADRLVRERLAAPLLR